MDTDDKLVLTINLNSFEGFTKLYIAQKLHGLVRFLNFYKIDYTLTRNV